MGFLKVGDRFFNRKNIGYIRFGESATKNEPLAWLYGVDFRNFVLLRNKQEIASLLRQLKKG